MDWGLSSRWRSHLRRSRNLYSQILVIPILYNAAIDYRLLRLIGRLDLKLDMHGHAQQACTVTLSRHVTKVKFMGHNVVPISEVSFLGSGWYNMYTA